MQYVGVAQSTNSCSSRELSIGDVIEVTERDDSGLPAAVPEGVDGQPSQPWCPELRRARILVVAGAPLEGAAIRALLERGGLVSVHVESPTRAIRMLSQADDIVVWIADHFDSDSLGLAMEMRAREPRVGLCLVGNGADVASLRELIVADPARFAFVERRRNPGATHLLEALERIALHTGTLGGALLKRVLADAGPSGRQLDELTEAERQVLDLLAKGLRNAEIARRLWKSEKTVEKHVRQVFLKLGLDLTSSRHLDRRVSAARIYLAEIARSEW